MVRFNNDRSSVNKSNSDRWTGTGVRRAVCKRACTLVSGCLGTAALGGQANRKDMCSSLGCTVIILWATTKHRAHQHCPELTHTALTMYQPSAQHLTKSESQCTESDRQCNGQGGAAVWGRSNRQDTTVHFTGQQPRHTNRGTCPSTATTHERYHTDA